MEECKHFFFKINYNGQEGGNTPQELTLAFYHCCCAECSRNSRCSVKFQDSGSEINSKHKSQLQRPRGALGWKCYKWEQEMSAKKYDNKVNNFGLFLFKTIKKAQGLLL